MNGVISFSLGGVRLLCATAIVLAVFILESGCAPLELHQAAPHGEEGKWEFDKEKWTPCFGRNPITSSRRSHPVYCLGEDRSKPPVVLLHELTGLSQETLDYAESLSADFTVYVPMLFGEPSKSSVVDGLVAILFSGEWARGVELDHSTPIVMWLRDLVERIRQNHNEPIGVIGNCLTGSLPLTLLGNPSVNAIVLAQPALPLRIFWYSTEDRGSVGVSPQVIEMAKDRLSSKMNKSEFWVYGTRFEKDPISWRDKQKFLKDAFKERYIDAEIPASEYLTPELSYNDDRKKAHSTLIREWHPRSPEGAASRRIRDEVHKFLKDPRGFCGSLPSCTTSIR